MILVLCLVLGVTAVAQDAPQVEKKAPPEIAESRWIELVAKAAEDESLTTVQRVDAIREAIGDALIRRRGKISDVKPSKWEGADTVTVHVVRILDGAAMRQFVARPEDAPVFKAWERWDRISWLERPALRSDGNFYLEAVYDSALDLTRTPNPGIEYAPPPKPEAAQFSRWVRRFYGEVLEADSAGAWRLFQHARDHAFVVPAVVRTVFDNGARIVVDLEESTQVRDSRARRTHGPSGKGVTVRIVDPQVRAAIREGDQVKVWITTLGPSSQSALRDGGYRIRFESTFARLVD